MERKTKALLVSAVLALAVLSGVAVMVYANGATNDPSISATDVAYRYDGQCLGGRRAFLGGERGGFITVSQGFKDNVLSIAENDTDVQKLLSEGYNVTGVRPIINATVEAGGTVTFKATSAIVTLVQGTTGRAYVWVNVEQAKVTRIKILTITVIEKP